MPYERQYVGYESDALVWVVVHPTLNETMNGARWVVLGQKVGISREATTTDLSVQGLSVALKAASVVHMMNELFEFDYSGAINQYSE